MSLERKYSRTYKNYAPESDDMVCNTGQDYLLINHVYVGSTIVAHAGDGNFHVIILFDPTNEKEVKEATDLSAGMVHLALEKEGMMG